MKPYPIYGICAQNMTSGNLLNRHNNVGAISHRKICQHYGSQEIKINCVIFKYYSSEDLTAPITLLEVTQPGTHFTAKSTEAMRIKSLAQGHNIQMPGFDPSTSVSRNRHFNHMINMLLINLRQI